MAKYTFICEHQGMNGSIERLNKVEFYAETWDEIVYEVNDFLRGSGFHFDGEVRMVQSEEEEDFNFHD